jgi:hypothetical protein
MRSVGLQRGFSHPACTNDRTEDAGEVDGEDEG